MMQTGDISCQSYQECPEHCKKCTFKEEKTEDARFNDAFGVAGYIETSYICTLIQDDCPDDFEHCDIVDTIFEALRTNHLNIRSLSKDITKKLETLLDERFSHAV